MRYSLIVRHSYKYFYNGGNRTLLFETLLKKKKMAKNPPTGDGHRIGAVRQRSQVFNPRTGLYVKRNAENGQFMDVKQDGTPCKGVRKER